MIRRDPIAPGRVVLERIVVPDDAPPRRLDQAVFERFDALPTRASARKACERGEIAVNGEISESSRWVGPADALEQLESSRPPPKVTPQRLDIRYLDDWLAVVVKPTGMSTSGVHARTLEKALPYNFGRSPLPDALPYARPVHRLDAPTAGLVLVARARGAHAVLGRAFEHREVHKRYRAIAVGRLEGEGTVAEEIDGRSAVSRWVAVGWSRSLRTEWATTLDLFPETGRTHQLRRHLASLGHPILGDSAYGLPGKTLFGKGLFLFAAALAFDHPTTGERLSFELEEPAKFAGLRARENRRFETWKGTDPAG